MVWSIGGFLSGSGRGGSGGGGSHGWGDDDGGGAARGSDSLGDGHIDNLRGGGGAFIAANAHVVAVGAGRDEGGGGEEGEEGKARGDHFWRFGWIEGVWVVSAGENECEFDVFLE